VTEVEDVAMPCAVDEVAGEMGFSVQFSVELETIGMACVLEMKGVEVCE